MAKPLWADGGSGQEVPSGHVLTAWPDRVDRLRVDTLDRGELASWLRARLPRRGESTLAAVLLSYDAGRNLEDHPATAREDPQLPDVVIARYPAWITAPESAGPWELVSRTDEDAARLQAWLERREPAPQHPALPTGISSPMDRSTHRQAVERILAGIAAGDLYQANVARRLEVELDPYCMPDLYGRLRGLNPAAYGVLWALDEGTWIGSMSPECLLTWDPGRRAAKSRPIKGTRPRGRDADEDRAMRDELTGDPKERAEHLMIVDLVRNDLGRVAVPGGVRVDDLFGVQTLPTVHHMVSEVVAKVDPAHDLADILCALFPGGSITGAPKIAAMKHIEEVEGIRRGFYTGSFGLVDGRTGQATFNILIRTCVAADGRLLYQTGGGIVADSDPDREWEETEMKAWALTRTLEGA